MIKAPTDLTSGKGLFLVNKSVFWLCPHRVEGVREPCGVPLLRALIPLVGAPPPTKAPPPQYHHTYEFWSQHLNGGGTNIRSMAPLWQ